jgi:hypothetical protein
MFNQTKDLDTIRRSIEVQFGTVYRPTRPLRFRLTDAPTTSNLVSTLSTLQRSGGKGTKNG